jgi:hypothetical protein
MGVLTRFQKSLCASEAIPRDPAKVDFRTHLTPSTRKNPHNRAHPTGLRRPDRPTLQAWTLHPERSLPRSQLPGRSHGPTLCPWLPRSCTIVCLSCPGPGLNYPYQRPVNMATPQTLPRSTASRQMGLRPSETIPSVGVSKHHISGI